jgi:hypothetical protein
VASFRSRVRLDLWRFIPSQNLCRSIGWPGLRHPVTDLITTLIPVGIVNGQYWTACKGWSDVAHEMEEPGQRNGLSLGVAPPL